MANKKAISRALSKALSRAQIPATTIPVDPASRIVIFSDHHKGARNQADDFLPCEATYLHALDTYYDQGFSLMILGDSEELWEERAKTVITTYANVMESEARFHPDRYFKAYGNHDDNWKSPKQVKQHLHPHFPDLKVHEGFLLTYKDGGINGRLFLVHGHQGTCDSDWLAPLGRIVLPLYRYLQIWFKIGATTPSKDACLRAEHDTVMYEWSQEQEKLLLIAGHTHRPVWSSQTHLQKLINQLTEIQEKMEAEELLPAFVSEQMTKLTSQIAEREKKYPPCKESMKTKPTYFNTGSCRFSDGDITGIEIENGEIRLIKWELTADNRFQRFILEKEYLTEIFHRLS